MSMRYPGGFIASTPVTAAYPSGVWTQAQAIPYQAQNVWTRDQYWPYTTLLLQGNGTNGAQNNTFLDSSSNNFTITRNGSTTQGSFTPYEQDGYWSNYFGGSSDYLTLANNAAFDLGTGDCTIEAWIFTNSLSATQAVFSAFPGSGTISGYTLLVNTSGTISMDSWVSGTNQGAAAGNYPISVGSWFHIAYTRSGGTNRIFVNGNLCTLSTNTLTQALNTGGNTPKIGYQGYSGFLYPFNGYISNLRIVKGTAVYTAAFTPSTAPLTAITNTSLLTCQSNRFRDNSTNNFTISTSGSPSVQAFQPFPGATTYSSTLLGGSAFFPNVLTTGSVAYSNFLTLTNAAVNLSGASYTMEAWVCPNQYPSGTPPQELISVFEWYAAFDNRWGLGISSNAVYVYTDGPSAAISASFVVPLNAWTHLAASWDGTTTRLFANGTLLTSNSTNYARNLSTLNIGRSRYSQYGITDLGAFPGYMADMRIVRGSAVYTASFTPPTAPLTAVTNTQLLLSCTNAGISDAAVMNDLETVGNAQVSTSVVKYGTGSMAFDGSGDYLSIPDSEAWNYGAGNFTIEFWANFNVFPSSTWAVITSQYVDTNNRVSVFFGNNASNENGLVFKVVTGGTTYKAVENDNASISMSSLGYSTGVWYHVAIVRNGNNIIGYVNGVQRCTLTTSATFPNLAASQLIGVFSGSADFPFNGYIDDLRITKSARYLTSFTPPPARMPGQ